MWCEAQTHRSVGSLAVPQSSSSLRRTLTHAVRKVPHDLLVHRPHLRSTVQLIHSKATPEDILLGSGDV